MPTPTANKKTEKRRIGLFGGTFNPIHNGHLSACRQVYRCLELERVYVIPCAVPPHKDTGQLVSGRDRLAMVKLALAGDPVMLPSDLELKRPGPSFSIDTVLTIKTLAGEQAELFFIVGLDAFVSIHTWQAWRQLLAETSMAVMSRPLDSGNSSSDLVKQLETYLHSTVSLRYRYHRHNGCFRHPDLKPVYPIKVSPVDVSSSNIRRRLRRGHPIEAMVPEAVAAYIRKKGLYR